jgi:hypothetical protein
LNELNVVQRSLNNLHPRILADVPKVDAVYPRAGHGSQKVLRNGGGKCDKR